MEADSSQVATALLTEHLQYTPLSLIDDIINSVNNFVYQGVGSLETGLLSTPPERLGFKPQQDANGNTDYPESKQEIDEGLQKLETLLNSTVDKNFDRFELYTLRNVLSLPLELTDWLRLKHYENVSLQHTQDAPTVDSVELLRRKLQASRSLSRALMQEQARNEALLGQIRALGAPNTEGSLAFLTQSSPSKSLNLSTNSQAISTNTDFAMTQLPALKQLLAQVRPRLTAMKEISISIDSAKDEMNQERRNYIEQRTKSHLERNGAALSDNAAALAGKPLDPDEIQALEKVAQTFNPP